VVFIGQGLDQTLLTETLNEVLLTDSEWSQWEKVGREHVGLCMEAAAEIPVYQIMTSKRKTEEQKRQKLFELFEGESCATRGQTCNAVSDV
jgi:GTPase